MNKFFDEYKRFFDELGVDYSYDVYEVEETGMTVGHFYIDSMDKLAEIELQAFQWGCEYKEKVSFGGHVYVHYQIELDNNHAIWIAVEIPTH